MYAPVRMTIHPWKPYLAFPNKIVIPSVPGFPASPLSLATTYVVLPKENHMQSTEVATLDMKSGEAEGSAVRPSDFPSSEVSTQTLQAVRHHRKTIAALAAQGQFRICRFYLRCQREYRTRVTFAEYSRAEKRISPLTSIPEGRYLLN
jgi:hypothetical protein